MEPKRLITEPSAADQALVMLVEDDAGVREALTFLLETEGFQTRAFRSGAEFLADPHLADAACFVLDYHLPGLSGLDVLAILGARGYSTPTVLITGSPTPDLERRAVYLGAIAVLEKPLSDNWLTLTIRAVLYPNEARSLPDAARFP